MPLRRPEGEEPRSAGDPHDLAGGVPGERRRCPWVTAVDDGVPIEAPELGDARRLSNWAESMGGSAIVSGRAGGMGVSPIVSARAGGMGVSPIVSGRAGGMGVSPIVT